MLGKKNTNRKLFYGIQIENFVDDDDYYRKLKASLPDLKFLYTDERVKNLYGTTGNKSLDPVVFFLIELVGYIENEVSDHKLAKYIKSYMPARWFINYDLDEATPWHSTISRTRQKMPESLYQEVFEKILRKCVKSGLVGGEHQSQDSTLIKANASIDSIEQKKPKLTVLEHYKKTRENNKTPEIDANQEKKLELKKEATPKKEQSSKKIKTNEKYIHKYEPDSKIVSKPNCKSDMYYKGSLTADSLKGIITDARIEKADKDDRDILLDTIDGITEKFRFLGLDLKRLAADGNYFSNEVLSKLTKKEIEAYIPINPATKKRILATKKFKYDQKNDEYICPMGARLSYLYYRTERKAKVYKCNSEFCNKCTLSKECTTSKNGRRLHVSKGQKNMLELIERLKKDYAKKAAIYRKTQTEGAFSHLKNNLGLRRFLVHGIEQVNKKFILGAAVYNLKKLIKYKKNGNPPLKSTLKVLNSSIKWIKLFYDCLQELMTKIKLLSYSCKIFNSKRCLLIL